MKNRAEVNRDIHTRLKELEDNTATVRRGEVTATSPLTIKLGASTATIPSVKKLAAYTTPVIGDQVQVLRWGKDLFVLGKIA